MKSAIISRGSPSTVVNGLSITTAPNGFSVNTNVISEPLPRSQRYRYPTVGSYPPRKSIFCGGQEARQADFHRRA